MPVNRPRGAGQGVPVRRLPRLLVVAVLAFAGFERNPLWGAVQLFRGLAIQLALRWGTGQVLADPAGRSVLLWSRVSGPRPTSVAGSVRGVSAAVVAGTGLFFVSNTLLLVPMAAAATWLGADPGQRWLLVVAVVGLRQLVTLSRAATAFVVERRRSGLFPPAQGARWRVDYLAAFPLGAGHGGRLLAEFVRQADAAGAELVLLCDPRARRFYRRQGFHPVPVGTATGAVVPMMRVPRLTRVPSPPRQRTGETLPLRRAHQTARRVGETPLS